MILSHPAWGAWIEISQFFSSASQLKSHPAWGAWIEIFPEAPPVPYLVRRTPHGVRGLKYLIRDRVLNAYLVAPRMGCVD